MEVHHQIMILVTWFARSCAAPGEAIPVGFSLLPASFCPPRTWLEASSALTRQRPAMKKVPQATGPWTNCSPEGFALGWARSSPKGAVDLYVVCSSFVEACPVKEEERLRL